MTQSLLNEKSLWRAVQAELELALSALNYGMWVAVVSAENLTESSLDIICPNPSVKNKLETVYLPLIQESVNKIGKGTYTINFKLADKKPGVNRKFDEPLFQKLEVAPVEKSVITKSGLNPQYTFDNYIMGNTNRLAYAIANAVAENPGKRHNPFFLYSGVGLGKTHLVQAIGNQVLQKSPEKRVLYCTGENFTNELIESIQNKKTRGIASADAFRKKYRNTDLLIIDDIQFIAGKDATQQEFFHTFNDLYMSQKQIVLTSDRPPEEFKNIEERITSRFRSGILADIQQPDYELRVAILRSKRDKDQDDFPNEVIDFIAENVATNIRELEGAYATVLTNSKAGGKQLDIDLAKQALGSIVAPERNKPININNILKAVCNYYTVKAVDIKGKRRTKELVIPRQVAMYLMYELTKTPYMSIGEVLGGRDHTTVMHGVRKVEEELANATSTKKDVMSIKQFIYQN